MRNKILVAFLCVLLISCGEIKTKELVEVTDREYEIGLTFPVGSVVGDVQFSEKGAKFDNTQLPSYILLDSLNFIQTTPKNISMWLKFDGEDGRIPQMIFSIKDTTDYKKKFNMWIAGRRVTAVLNANHLWANEYDYSKGKSKTYYDSYLLEPGKYYFLSVNYTPQKVQIFVNAELYQQFENLESGDIQFHKIYLGIELYENEYRNPYFGHLRNLTIFDRTLESNEIYSLSVENYQDIYEFNKAHELSKFNFDQK